MSARQRSGEQGFSLIELLIVLSIVGILANIAVPMLLAALDRAHAAAVLGDANAIFEAAAHYRLDNGVYPRNRGWRRRPPELNALLEGVSFQRGDLWYRWRRQRTRHGLMVRATGDQAVLDRVRSQWSGASVRWRDRLYLYEPN